ncbi:MAG: sigma-54-dependent transcriptional regulator [Leptospirales bacterium]
MKVLVIDDEESLLDLLIPYLSRHGHETRGAKGSDKAYALLGSSEWDLVLLDIRLGKEDGIEVLHRIRRDWPSVLVIMMTAFGRIDQAVETLKAGAFDFLEKPFTLSFLALRMEKVEAHLALKSANGVLREELGLAKGELVGHHPLMREIRKQIDQFSSVDLPVLITGESGTGKEIAARLIVGRSARNEGPFIVMNCGAIPENLMESLFFGHEKGAFTGAHTLQKGKFELAEGGTIFLDELGELPLHLQVKLLRVIETGEFERVGGDKTIRTNVRIVSATNRDLTRMIRCGEFRLDLFYRLNVLNLEMPPLRNRMEDLPDLVKHLLGRLSRDLHRKLVVDRSLMPVLQSYEWLGNIRELRNVLERLAVLSKDGVLRGRDLPNDLRNKTLSEVGKQGSQEWSFRREMAQRERNMIVDALERARGNHTLAARFLGMKRTTLQYRLKKMHLYEVVKRGGLS